MDKSLMMISNTAVSYDRAFSQNRNQAHRQSDQQQGVTASCTLSVSLSLRALSTYPLAAESFGAAVASQKHEAFMNFEAQVREVECNLESEPFLAFLRQKL